MIVVSVVTLCVNHTMQVSVFNHSSNFDVGECVSGEVCGSPCVVSRMSSRKRFRVSFLQPFLGIAVTVRTTM